MGDLTRLSKTSNTKRRERKGEIRRSGWVGDNKVDQKGAVRKED